MQSTFQVEAPEAGTYLVPNLRVIDVLGRGGMGIVLRAHDEALARDVAVKLVHPRILGGEAALEAFLEEARAMARVRHQNVVQIFTFGEIGAGPYFTMEHVNGPSLAEHLRGSGPLAYDEAMGVLRNVSSGMEAIHASGTVHGDLKPSNILLDGKHVARVTDFGLTLDASTGGSAFVGTPHYVAPERIREAVLEETLRPRADVYSFGVLAFQLLTGELPFNAPDVGRIYAQHLYKPRPLPSLVRPELPPGIDEIIPAAMHCDPVERTKTTRDVVEALEQIRFQTKRPTRRVLIVDDDADFRSLVRACLETELGVETVEEAENGRDALLSLIDGKRFDLLVVDLHMPLMNGLELTASIRENAEMSEGVRILVVSGHGSASDWQVLTKIGADAFMVKPCGPEDLVMTAGQLLYPKAS